MSLRTRIAVTFLLLLSAVLAAALAVVSAANRANAEREVNRQLDVGASVFSRLLESNRSLLTQAAQAVAADFGFREAVAVRDVPTLESALENAGDRVGAQLVVLTSLDGKVMAAYGSSAVVGSRFAAASGASAGADAPVRVIVDAGRVFQLVTVAVKSPLPVAWISMGFALDDRATRELASVTGLDVTLAYRGADGLRTVSSSLPARESGAAERVSRRIALSDLGGVEVTATLSRSLRAALAPFARLTEVLVFIAVFSVAAFAWAAFWLARTITRPVQALTQAVDRIRGGDYGAPLDVRRPDELGVLADGLQHMQAAVQNRDRSIRRLAYEDPLTSLMNRTAFAEQLAAALRDPAAPPMAVAMINLQRFQRINEHLGYSVGDAVLIRVAARLRAVPWIGSGVARLAADQFAAYAPLPPGTDPETWGRALLAAFSEPVVVENQPIDINTTVGLVVATSVPQGVPPSPDELLRCAELALVRARRDKRDLCLYGESLRPAARDQLSLLGELRRAVDGDELRLHYQPKIELATGRVAGAEVLLRWQHPTRGLLGPGAFVPFAEQTGFIRRITRWTLDRAVAQGAEWYRSGCALSLAVNISAEDLGDLGLLQRVAHSLSRHQLPPSLLTLEITESGFIDDPDRALKLLEGLAALGLNLSVDDFGTGYSSLSHLARMPVHEMKIDRSFVVGLQSQGEYAAVVRSAIDMGHSLGLKVVAEGIEDAASAAMLKSLGCDVAQGYFYAKPMAPDDFAQWLKGQIRIPVIAVPRNFNIDDVGDSMSLAVL